MELQYIIKGIEIFAHFSGLVYIILEVLQKNVMWYFGIATGLACAFQFYCQDVWASMGLNIYYVAVSVWGLIQWKRDSQAMEDKSAIHLNHFGMKPALWSLLAAVIGIPLLNLLLDKLGDPLSLVDSIATVLSAIATVWLAKSYWQQWLVWVVADVFSATLCFMQGTPWMGVLYIFYTASSCYGIWHWRKYGTYVS